MSDTNDNRVEPMMPKRRPPGLGRGLSALLGDATPLETSRADGVREIAIADITPHPSQPRRHFDDEALAELAASIGTRGVLQPIVVRPVGDRYQIVAGERRWRAAQAARLHSIPAIVRVFDEGTTLEIALIENIQREQLNAIEEGEAYRRLIDAHGHSADALGKLLHKSRSHIANLMRLVDLPAPVRALIAEKKWVAAIAELKSVNDPTSADWNNLMGYSYRKANTPDYAAAERYYDEALRIAPKHRGALEYSGELYLIKGDLATAEQRLAALDKACFLPCEEYSDLKAAIARYKAGGNKYVAK